jgi:hypothetical protein
MPNAYASNYPENQDRPKSWRDILPIHPACNRFEPVSAGELRDLVANIAKHGLRDKIDIYFKDEKCVLVDGQNRLDALASLGKKVLDDKGEPLKDICNVREFHDDAEVINFIISKNIIRRHLTPTERRKAIGELLKINPEKSNRQIATELGGSHVTVGAVREELESTGQIGQLSKTTGKDGKSRPTKKKQASAKVTGSLNGSHPTPKVGAKSSAPIASPKFEESAKALSEFKFACDHWLPKMTSEHRSEATAIVAGFVGHAQ